MPSLVVYKRILYRSGWASQVLFITYTIVEGLVGLGLCSILTMPSLVVYKRILYRSGWASLVLFITYTIIEGLVGPAPVHNLDHAFTGCLQKDIVSVRLGITGVIHYIYNH